ncbi:MAG: hypothetical protein AAF982_11680 [Pseudomonadota bacterium]
MTPDGLLGAKPLDGLVDAVGDVALFGNVGLTLGDQRAPGDERRTEDRRQDEAVVANGLIGSLPLIRAEMKHRCDECTGNTDDQNDGQQDEDRADDAAEDSSFGKVEAHMRPKPIDDGCPLLFRHAHLLKSCDYYAWDAVRQGAHGRPSG